MEKNEFMSDTVNKNATEEARELLKYLASVAGKGIITGQHTQTNPMEEIEYIYEVTGHKPKLQGFEMLAYSPNINFEDASEPCLTEVYENQGTMETARKWAKETGGIVTLSFHWFSPIGGRDKSFYAEHTDFDASKILVEGSAERKAFYSDMEKIAVELKKFQDEKIPVLWRPFHEADGQWFWWGAKGPEVAVELYKMMFEYYVYEKKLDNLIWVWNFGLADVYPGDEFCDIVSMDIYLDKYRETDYAEEYEKLIGVTSKKKLVALAEVGYNPDVKVLEKSRIPWVYYMTWSKEFIMGEKYNSKEKLREMFESEYSVKM